MGPEIEVRKKEVLPEPVEDCAVLSVSDLISMGLQNNPLTLRTWADARAAAFNWEASKSQLFPVVNVQESLEFNVQKGLQSTSGGNTLAAPGYSRQFIHDVTVSYLLFDFGGRDASIDSARHALFATNWTHNRSLQDVIVGVLRAYYFYIESQALYEAQKLNVEDAKKNYESAEAQYQVGVRTKVDALQAKSQYINSLLTLEQAWGNLKTAMGELAASIGVTADTVLKVVPLPEHLPIDQVTHNMDDLLEMAKTARPDLSAAYALYIKRQSDVTVVRSSGLPTITAGVEYQWINDIHRPRLNSHFRQGVISLNIPLFAGFLYYNQERQAKALVDSAFADLQQTESNVLLDVVTAYYAFKTAGESVKFSEEFLKYAQEAYDATLEGYRAGTNTITDLLNAQLTLANARAQLIQSKTQWVTSLANIAYATGNM